MRRRRKLPPVPASLAPNFTPFADAQRAAMDTLLQQTFRDLFRGIARDGYAEVGRGLVVWVSPNGTFRGLRPPSYVALTTWQRHPLLVNTPHADLLHAIHHYDPATAYVVLCVISDAVAPSHGRYSWWQITDPDVGTATSW